MHTARMRSADRREQGRPAGQFTDKRVADKAAHRSLPQTRGLARAPRVGLAAVGLALATVSLWLVAAPASACGGLFCSASSPVNQAAERIIFAFDKEAEEVTAVVEILYEGPSERFAWVLPVPGIPTVGVSSGHLLDRLQQSSNPQFTVQRDFSNQCDSNAGGGGVRATSADEFAGDDDDDNAESDVTVLASGSAGPYDYEVIRVNPALPDRAQVALDWLTANQYDVTALGPEVLRPYLDGDMNLLAFRLSKNSATGSIRPVMLTYESAAPMIPIRPTAVAANDDMGVLVWVLSSARAVPTNYKDLELNELLIDWFNPQTTYNNVVIAAADEAGGQGFVTEQAGPSTQFAQLVNQEQGLIGQFRRSADGLSNERLVRRIIESFTVFAPANVAPGGGAIFRDSGVAPIDGLSDVLSRNLDLPAGVTLAAVMARPQCYFPDSREREAFYCEGQPAPTAAEIIDLTALDRMALLRDVEALVIKPLEDTAELFANHSYITRLYTTLSASEMTLDPFFDLNAEMPDVSNQHTVTLVYGDDTQCFDIDGSWTATVKGFKVRGEGSVWPLSMATQEMPALIRMRTLATSGEGIVEVDNTDVMVRTLSQRFEGLEQNPGQPEGTGQETASSSGGCSVAAGSRGAGGLALMLLALAIPRRRRQQQ